MGTKGNGAIDYAGFGPAIGLNWYLVDPKLRVLMDKHIAAEQRDWAGAAVPKCA